MKDRYIVSIVRVPGVTRQRMCTYIQEAVSIWGGQLPPQIIMELQSDPNHKGKGRPKLVEVPVTGDPLGPPCPLMDRGAVTVQIVKRGAIPFAVK